MLGSSFTYVTGIGPIISSVSPNIVSGSAPNDFVISGSQFSNGDLKPTVKIGDADCLYIQHTSTSISCQSDALGHGIFNARVFVADIGGSEITQNSEILSELSIESISPTSGSVLGGTDLEITGTNFGTDPSVVEVTLGDKKCAVTNVTDTTILCRTSSFTKTTELRNDGTDESKLFTWSMVFGFRNICDRSLKVQFR